MVHSEWPPLKLVCAGLLGLAVGLVVMRGLSSRPVTFCCVVKCRCRIPFLPLLWHHLCSQEHAQLVPICRGISGVGIGSPPCSRRLTTGMENILAAVAWKSAHLTLSVSLSSLSHQQDLFHFLFYFLRVFVSLLLLEGPVSLLGQLGLSEAISMLRLIKFSADRLQRIQAFLVGCQLFLLIWQAVVHLQNQVPKILHLFDKSHLF